MKMKLTKRAIGGARYQGTGADYRWDTGLPAFGVRVYPSGLKSFVVTYRARGVQRFHTLGRFGELTVYEAQGQALEILGTARRGEDPSGVRLTGHKAPTMAMLEKRYLHEHGKRLKPGSLYRARRIWQRFITPALGKRKVPDISRTDVAELLTSLADTPTQANAVRSILSTAFNLAEVWGWRAEGTNPCRLVRRNKLEGRERFLSEAELGRLADALSECEREHPDWTREVAAIRLLALTGCRSGEILALKWSEVDFERRCLHLPDSKTGAKDVILNTAALEVLAGIEPVEGNPHVVPGKKAGSHLTHLHRPWSWVRERAKLQDVRLHDLRHTYASYGVGAGLSLPVVGRLLGHSTSATTERYAHLADDPVRQAAERIGAEITAAMDSRPPAEVIPLRDTAATA